MFALSLYVAFSLSGGAVDSAITSRPSKTKLPPMPPASNISQATPINVNPKALGTPMEATTPSYPNALTIDEAGCLSALSNTTKPMFYNYYGEGRCPC